MPHRPTRKDFITLTDPKLVIKKETWNKFSVDEKLEIIYDTTISARDSNIELSKKVDEFINKAPTPCVVLESRIEKLEKWSKLKAVATVFSGFLSGFGGSHIPK